MFAVANMTVGVFHVGGRFFALANECPHGGASLAHGIVEGDVVLCRIHHWRFSLRDGTYLDEAEPQCNARSFPVRVVGDEVQVAVSVSGREDPSKEEDQ
jgi:nitrite reductase/ring-hydroxylating ferredoxin subunit